jgi:hypothetical protein
MKEIAQSLEHALPIVLEYNDEPFYPHAVAIISVDKSVHLNRPQYQCIDNHINPSYDMSTVGICHGMDILIRIKLS